MAGTRHAVTRVAEGAATKVPQLPQKILERENELERERWEQEHDDDLRTSDSSGSASRSVGTIAFADVAAETGLDFQYNNGHTGFEHLIESMGGGVLVIDDYYSVLGLEREPILESIKTWPGSCGL